MKFEDKGQKVVITLTYREAELLCAHLWDETGWSKVISKLFNILDEYINT